MSVLEQYLVKIAEIGDEERGTLRYGARRGAYVGSNIGGTAGMLHGIYSGVKKGTDWKTKLGNAAWGGLAHGALGSITGAAGGALAGSAYEGLSRHTHGLSRENRDKLGLPVVYQFNER